MKIEYGKYYKTRDGRKVGPMVYSSTGGKTPWFSDDAGLYHDDGTFIHSETTTSLDLIAEWQDATTTSETDLAALAAQHRIKITVQVGEVLIEYDGRGK